MPLVLLAIPFSFVLPTETNYDVITADNKLPVRASIEDLQWLNCPVFSLMGLCHVGCDIWRMFWGPLGGSLFLCETFWQREKVTFLWLDFQSLLMNLNLWKDWSVKR